MKSATLRALAPAVLLVALASGCYSVQWGAGGRALPYEARSLSGEPLESPVIDDERLPGLRDAYADALEAYRADPASDEAAVWLGRRLAYLGRYRDAVDVYTAALVRHPASAKLLRHRGHRFLTLRRLAEAEADLALAAALVDGEPDEVEPDGAPNAAGIPRSTLQSNVWYHLGLARFCQGDFEGAAEAYDAGLVVSAVNDDMLVATLHWQWMTLDRLGRDAEAAALLERVHADMEILENHAYHEVLLMRKGLRTPETVLAAAESDVAFASAGFGVAMHWRAAGNAERADELLREIVERGPWMAFGALAAEAELAR